MKPDADDSTPDPAGQNRSIIADDSHSRWLLAIVACATIVGCWAAVHYARIDLTLSHYDTKGHLVVARRILDSLNPGWVQIGAVWLPLPHLLQMLPVQVDALYRTGYAGVFVSVVCFAITAGLLAALVAGSTGSRVAGTVAAVALVTNPDILYLQATPMTEPLLLALTTATVWAVGHAMRTTEPVWIRRAGWLMAAACMTRYEAWPLSAAVLGLGGIVACWNRRAWRTVVSTLTTIVVYPAWVIAGFLVLGRASTGAWFTTSGFFVPENVATGRPFKAVLSVWWGTHELTSYTLASLAVAGFVVAAIAAIRRPHARWVLVLAALAATAALPTYAFYAGHPFRIRYMVPLVPAIAAGLGLLVGAYPSRVWRGVSTALVGIAILTGPVGFDPRAPMVLEAQWDRPNREARRAVTAYLRQHWDRSLVLASMGSLAHYMQELSEIGFELSDFVHEGNGEIWDAASTEPGHHVEWVLVEERSEGGDVLAQRAAARPAYFRGFERVAEGGGVALYHRHQRALDHGSPLVR